MSGHDVKYLNNGTATFQNTNGDTMYQCQYCETWFMPNRRFMQKFCSESCRVMACRNRKKGLYGVLGGSTSSRNKTTNTELYNIVNELREQVKDLQSDNERSNVKTKDTLQDIKLKQIKIKNNQDWHIFLSITMPLIAPKISQAIGKLFSSKTPEDIEEFTKKAEPILKNAPEELREQILSVTKNFFDQEESKKKPRGNPHV